MNLARFACGSRRQDLCALLPQLSTAVVIAAFSRCDITWVHVKCMKAKIIVFSQVSRIKKVPAADILNCIAL